MGVARDVSREVREVSRDVIGQWDRVCAGKVKGCTRTELSLAGVSIPVYLSDKRKTHNIRQNILLRVAGFTMHVGAALITWSRCML